MVPSQCFPSFDQIGYVAAQKVVRTFLIGDARSRSLDPEVPVGVPRTIYFKLLYFEFLERNNQNDHEP
jgi:hypothetical protein